MKVLLDENLDHRLRKMLFPHDVQTASFAGFAGLKNGKLLQAAIDAGFEAFLTADRTLQYEQNLAAKPLKVVVLSTLDLVLLKTCLPRVLEALATVLPSKPQTVDCGKFNRKRERRLKSSEEGDGA